MPPVGQNLTCGNGPWIDFNMAVPPAASAGKNFKNLNPCAASFMTSLGVAAPGKKDCNAKEIYNSVVYFLKNPDLIKKQIHDCQKTLLQIKSKTSSSDEAANILNKYLVS